MTKCIALFFPALISISIYSRRHSATLAFKGDILVKYGIYVMMINLLEISLLTYILGININILESMESSRFYTKYVFIAVLFAWLMPYLEEIIKKSIHVKFQIEAKSVEKHENDQKD